MPGGSPWEAFIEGYIFRLITQNSRIEDILNQMTFGLINIAPPNGEPSLTSQLNNIVFQIQSLREHLDTANTEMISQNVDILAAIAALPDGTAPVVLPSPPAGYGGASTSDIALDVWSFVLGQGEDTGSALDDLYGSRISLFGNTFVHLPGFPWMVGYSLNAWQNYAEGNIVPPVVLDAATILPSDASILAWANRAHHGPLGWTNTGFRGTTVPMQLDTNRSDVKWVITMTPQEFADFQTVPATLNTPPVWPGYANITFSTAHALATGLSINTPMDGVIIDITGVPTRANFYQFDNVKSYRNLGALTFYDDNGDFEYAQSFGLETQILTPHTMKRAAGVKLRTEGGVSGTVSPWTINP